MMDWMWIMVYLTKKQRNERLRTYIGSIQESIDENGLVVPDRYLVNFIIANDLEPQFINTSLAYSESPRGREMMTYSFDELETLARQLDISFESKTVDSIFDALTGIAIDANIKEMTDGQKERLYYHINVDDAVRSEIGINHGLHFENTKQLEDEFLSMTMDSSSSLSLVAFLSENDYDSPDTMNDMESLFYAEKALNSGNYEYADARPHEVMGRIGDVVDIPNSDRTLYNLFFKNEMKAFGIRDKSPEVIDGGFGVIPVYDNVEDLEHDPFASLDIDYENAPPLENFLIGIDDGVVEVVDKSEPQLNEVTVESELDSVSEVKVPTDENGLLIESGEVDASDRKGKRLFIDGEPQKVQTETTGEYRYNIPLSLANDRLHPMDAYVKPKLNTANQWYNQREMDRVANATHVPVDYRMDDFDKKALESDLVRTKNGEYRLDTNTLKAVTDFDYDKHVETTKEVQSVYQLWKDALSSTGRALSVTAKDVMFRAYRLTEKIGEWRNNLKEEYTKWSVIKDEELNSTQKTPLKEKMHTWKMSLSDWSRGRSTGYMSESQSLSRVERAEWMRAQSIMGRLGFGKKEKSIERPVTERYSDKGLELE